MPFLVPILGLLMKWFNPETIINGAINAYMKAKDVDLEKFKSANATTDSMVAHILEANVRYDEIKSQYALSVLNWWPFRLILFALLFFPAVHFVAIVLDSSCPIVWHMHVIGGRNLGGCGWGIPDIDPSVADIYKQLLLFFILAKPADTAISGALTIAQRYLRK